MHKKKFVTSREIWTLYCLMIGSAFFWGGLWAMVAFMAFRFNREALMFLAVMAVTTGLCSGLTLYAGVRHLLGKVRNRVQDSDLELD